MPAVISAGWLPGQLENPKLHFKGAAQNGSTFWAALAQTPTWTSNAKLPLINFCGKNPRKPKSELVGLTC